MTIEELIRIAPGDAVQIDPAIDEVFAGCIAVVIDVRGWGITGYIQLCNGERTYTRLLTKDIELVGAAHWWSE